MDDETKQQIFQQLRSILASYVPPLIVTEDDEFHYGIYGDKRTHLGKRDVDNAFFASVVIRKHHVGFYFFPIYTHRESFANAPEDLMKLLKGKSCFHLKKYDDAIFDEKKKLLDKGFEIYRKEDWI